MLGGVFGLIRLFSGSVLAASLCHAVWNGINYPLFGFGGELGVLGIQQTRIFGPGIGMPEIGPNLAFLTWLWRKYTSRFAEITPKNH